MIRLAEEKDVPELKSLWRDVFQEEEAYLDAFFIRLFKRENALLYEVNGRIAAALHMIPYSIRIDGKMHRLLYLYAIGTLPAYRGKGCAGSITREALRIAKARGYSGVFLVPAEESLFRWYEGMGFKTVFHKTRIRIGGKGLSSRASAGSDGTGKLTQTSDKEELWNLYVGSPFYQDNWVTLNREQNDFFLDELWRTGGEAWVLEQEGRKHYALLQQEGEELVVYETDIDAENLPSFLSFAGSKPGIRSVVFHQPLCFGTEEKAKNSTPFAMMALFEGIALSKPGINRVLM